MIVYTLHQTLFAPDLTEQILNEMPVNCNALQRLPKRGGQTRQEEKTIVHIIVIIHIIVCIV